LEIFRRLLIGDMKNGGSAWESNPLPSL